jgi:hypothetical protein
LNCAADPARLDPTLRVDMTRAMFSFHSLADPSTDQLNGISFHAYMTVSYPSKLANDDWTPESTLHEVTERNGFMVIQGFGGSPGFTGGDCRSANAAFYR